MNDEIIKYAEGLGADQKVIDWVELQLSKKEGINQSEIEHVIDYLISDKGPKRLERATYYQMKKKSELWTKSLEKKGLGIIEVEKDTEVVLDFKDGFRIVKLIGKPAYEREGFLMRHCVASYFGNGKEIYSLRDKDNIPHCTIEKDQQIKGKGNGSIHPKYIEYVCKFLEWSGMEVKDNEMKNLGYINVNKIKKYLHKDNKLIFSKYWYKENKLKDLEGNEFLSFDLLDQIDLVSGYKGGVKINFDLNVFLKLSINFLFKQINKLSLFEKNKIGSSGNYAKIGSSGDSAQIGSSGNYAKIGSSGYSAKIGSSGFSAKIGSSGNYAKIGSSGNYAKIGSSGYSAKIGSSGYSAKIGSSGNSAKIGSSGNSAQIGSSGDSAKIGSSGNYAKIGSSGDYAKIGSSGDSAKIEITGGNNVCSAIGINSKIKSTAGNWITLAEYDGKFKPICVKSAQIDGDILKADIWYYLKNGEFVEAELSKD